MRYSLDSRSAAKSKGGRTATNRSAVSKVPDTLFDAVSRSSRKQAPSEVACTQQRDERSLFKRVREAVDVTKIIPKNAGEGIASLLDDDKNETKSEKEALGKFIQTLEKSYR